MKTVRPQTLGRSLPTNLLLTLLFLCLAIAPALRAATLTYDADATSGNGIQDSGGNAYWDNGFSDWWDTNALADVTWDNTKGNSAYFGGGGGAGGPVGIAGSVIVSNITFASTCGTYTFTNGGSGQIVFTNGGGVVTIPTGVSVTNLIATLIGGNVGWSLEGGGTFVKNTFGNETYSGVTYINNGTYLTIPNNDQVLFPGPLVVNTNGSVLYNGAAGSTGGSLLGGSRILVLNGGAFVEMTAKYCDVSKLTLDNGGKIYSGPSPSSDIMEITNMDARAGLVGGYKGNNRYNYTLLAKSTAGTLVITNRTYGGSAIAGYSNVTLNAGALILDKSLQRNYGLISGPIFLSGGALILSNSLSSSTAVTGEAITSTTLNPGASSVASLTNGTANSANGTLALTGISRQVGGTLNVAESPACSISTTTGNNNGILGGWATYNAADWAVGTTFAPYSAYQTSTDPTTWTPAYNVSLGASSVEVGNGTNINSLKLTDSATITLDGNFTLSSGGLLVTGSAAPTITGAGTLLGGSGADLIVQQYSSGNLTIASALANNTSATSLTKSGPGKLILTGTDTMTGNNYLNGGVVEVSDLAKLASGSLVMNGGTLRYTGSGVTDLRAIMLNGLGGTFDVSSSAATLIVSNLSNSDGVQILYAPAGNLMGNNGGLTKIGIGTLALVGSNYINGVTVVSNGTLFVNGTNYYDTSSWMAGRVIVYGGTLGGTGMISGPVTVVNGGTIAPGDDNGTLTLATNLNMAAGSTAQFGMVNLPGVSDKLVVQGNLTIGSGCTIAINVTGSPLATGTYTLIQYTGTKSGSFNTLPVIVGGSINGSYSISDSTSGEIDLVVNNQVVINSQPSDTNTVPGLPFSVSISAPGTAPVYYQWYYATTNNINTTNALGGATSASYSVAISQQSDSGYYYVIVTNAYNSVTSRVAYVLISPTAPVLSGPADQTVIENNNATLTATKTAGAPTPDYRWYFGTITPGSELTDNSHYTGSSTLSLTINNAQYPADQGTYSIVASNVAGLYTNSATLTVIVPPTFTTSPTNLTVNVGDTANFYAAATGVPTPTLQWYKNGVIMNGQTSSPLTIATAQGSDIATYSVVASNQAGVLTNSATLTVLSTTLASTAFAPTNGATGVCYDTPLYVTFNGPISIVNSGKIRIYNAAGPTLVDTIDMSSNTVIVSPNINLTNNVQPHSMFSGDSQVINYYPVMISGTTAAIYPHGGVMTSNQTYYVTMDSGVVADASGAYFAGISDPNAWKFTTKVGGPVNPTNLVVDIAGSGDFVTVQGAVDSVPVNNTSYTLINIRNGIYTEIVDISGKNNITFLGQSRLGTVVGYPNCAQIAPAQTTSARMSFKVNGSDIGIENLTLTNGTPQAGSQAECLEIYNNGLRCVVNNCDIVSRQDTILINAAASQGYFNNCRIVGNYDYIWGVGVGYFNNCVFHTLTNSFSTSYNLTAARTATSGTLSATTPWVNPNGTLYSAYGFTFVNCTNEADTGVANITLADSNGTPGGLDAWVFCQFATNAYVSPSTTLSNQYVFWQYKNTDISGNPISFATGSFTNVQTMGVTNNDPRLLAATNVVTWFSGWTPLPVITSEPQASLGVCSNNPASLSVTVTGSGLLYYQWQKGGVNLTDAGNVSGSTTPTLSLSTTANSDAGNYTVIITNDYGSVTSSVAVLTVNPLPDSTITAPATACANSGGYTASVPSGAAGYAWVMSGNGTITDGQGTHAITFSVGASGSVVLSCWVTNASECVSGGGQSTNVTIDDTAAITGQPHDTTATAGTSTNFTVTATGTGLTYQWQLNGVNLSDGGNISGVTTPTLTINPVLVSDAATAGHGYVCLVSPTCGTIPSTEALLTVTPVVGNPTVTITNALNKSLLTNTVIMGTAKAGNANGTLLAVKYAYLPTNGVWTAWQDATLSGPLSGIYTNWSAALTGANPGVLLFATYGENNAGNTNMPVTNVYTYVVVEPLGLSIIGSGTVKSKGLVAKTGTPPTLESTTNDLLLPFSYYYSATAAPGYLFSNYVLSAQDGQADTVYPLTLKNDVTFKMRTNALMTVQFVTDRFLNCITNSYYGLFLGSPVAFENSGLIKLSVSAGDTKTGKQKISGKMYIEGQQVSFVINLDLTGYGQASGLAVTNKVTHDTYVVTAQLDLDSGLVATGSVSNQVTSWNSPYTAYSSPYGDPNGSKPPTLLAPMATNYVMIITNSGVVGQPDGDGYATVILGPKGIKASGNYGDTAALGSGMQAMNVSSAGLWPYYQALYKDAAVPASYHGCAIGWLTFENGLIDGTLTWVKETDPGSIGIKPATYLTGFTNSFTVVSSGWTNTLGPTFNACFVPDGTYLVEETGGPVDLLALPVGEPWTNGVPFLLNKPAFGKNKAGFYTNNLNNVSLTLTPKTGKISGGFVGDAFTPTSDKFSYAGAILQNVNKAYGYNYLKSGADASTPANLQVTGEAKVEQAP